MKLKLYQIDAFADKVFSGNPAAVCPLARWLSDELMQKIAAENNLAETAFYVKEGDVYQLRWFTPKVEVDLCGHATLAAAFVLFTYEQHQGATIRFFSPRSGILTVTKQNDLLTLDFPADPATPVELTREILDCFDQKPTAVWKGKTDLMVIFRDEQQIQQLKPAFDKIARLGGRGIIATARGDRTDFVSRFFAPQVGVPEDPVTGSAHTTLTPYWAKQLNKVELTAAQLSERKGFLTCKLVGERVHISGQARLYLTGEIHLE
jgi:PhzF family phenazine biosynthesis protein